MSRVTSHDGVGLYYEETGHGTPLVFVHEFAGDVRSFEPQVRHFSRRYRCITYNARGYPPSDVPEDRERYSQAHARDDVRALLDALDIERAHVLGISMGAFATLHFGLEYPDRALSLTVGGCGYGSPLAVTVRFRAEAEAAAARIETEGMAAFAAIYSQTPARLTYRAKDPRGFAEFARQLSEHSATGSALTMRGVQGRRPSLYDLEDDLRALRVPTLLVTGDEDEPALDATLFLKRAIPSAGLVVLPRSGHALNLEEPGWFNGLVGDFLHQVETGRWGSRALSTPDGTILQS